MYCGGVDDGGELAGSCGVLALAVAEATALAASFVAHVASAVFAAFRSSARVGFVMALRMVRLSGSYNNNIIECRVRLVSLWGLFSRVPYQRETGQTRS